VRNLVVALGLVVAAGFAGHIASAQDQKPVDPAPAAETPANPCLDRVEAECAGVAGCVWLPGYTVASGAEVKGYCRPAPKPLTARRRPTAAPAAEQPK
jgi:hypothetical protein